MPPTPSASPSPAPSRPPGRARRFLRAAAWTTAVLVVIFLLGPRERVDFRERPLAVPEAVDAYLATSEARYRDITPGTEKTVVWAHPDHRRTPLSVVYLHGFSATRQETAPLSDDLARSLGANLFYTRLAGHGRGSAALGDATADDWLNDALEALAVGRRLGDQVIVLGASTGATLATWLALRPEAAHVRAFVLLSPNFGLVDPAPSILTWPWGRTLVKVLASTDYTSTFRSADEGRYWTNAYPRRAFIPMMALLHEVHAQPLEKITRPVLVVYSPKDTVVSATDTAATYARFGSPAKKIIPILASENPNHHILAGRILAPQGTAEIAGHVSAYLAALPR